MLSVNCFFPYSISNLLSFSGCLVVSRGVYTCTLTYDTPYPFEGNSFAGVQVNLWVELFN